MPTQEERITTLEQTFTNSQREQARQNRKTDENLTILLGLVQTQSIEIKRIFARLDNVDSRLETIESDVHDIKQDVHEVKTMLAQLINNSKNQS